MGVVGPASGGGGREQCRGTWRSRYGTGARPVCAHPPTDSARCEPVFDESAGHRFQAGFRRDRVARLCARRGRCSAPRVGRASMARGLAARPLRGAAGSAPPTEFTGLGRDRTNPRRTRARGAPTRTCRFPRLPAHACSYPLEGAFGWRQRQGFRSSLCAALTARPVRQPLLTGKRPSKRRSIDVAARAAISWGFSA